MHPNRVFGCRDEVGRDVTDLGRAVFGWESSRVEDIPRAKIPIRCRTSPSLEISWTGTPQVGRAASARCRKEERRGEEKREGRGRARWRPAGVEVHGRLRSGELRRWRSGETEIHRHRARPWEQSSAPGASVPDPGELRPWRHRARPRRAPPPAGARALGPALPPRRRRHRAARG